MHRSPVRCFAERQSVDTLVHRSAVAGAAAQQIVGRRFHMRPMTWSGAGLVAALASAALASAAQAQPSWQCSASAASSSLAGNPGANPVVAAANPCVSNATGLDNLPSPLGIPADAVSARTSSATTAANPENEIAARQAVGAIGRVENLAVQLPPGAGTTTLGVRAANGQVSATCVAGAPALRGSRPSTRL